MPFGVRGVLSEVLLSGYSGVVGLSGTVVVHPGTVVVHSGAVVVLFGAVLLVVYSGLGGMEECWAASSLYINYNHIIHNHVTCYTAV